MISRTLQTAFQAANTYAKDPISTSATYAEQNEGSGIYIGIALAALVVVLACGLLCVCRAKLLCDEQPDLEKNPLIKPKEKKTDRNSLFYSDCSLPSCCMPDEVLSFNHQNEFILTICRD